MYPLQRSAVLALVLPAACCLALYGNFGQVKPMPEWNWMDIVGEGGTAMMAAVWTVLIVGSRPSGRVTALLACGLGAIMLGAWVDCLDEFFAIPHTQYWDNWLESVLTPGGMLTLTIGLYFWRQEQWSLNEHMRKRERLFREHRSFDRITQLADAGYLRRQLRLERARYPRGECALILLDIDDFHRIGRDHGASEGDRVLQAISHLLLLNLRHDDLLCRYAGDRFAVLLPATAATPAGVLARDLQAAIAGLRHHTRDGACLRLSAQVAWGVPESDDESFLEVLNRRLEGAVPPARAGLAGG